MALYITPARLGFVRLGAFRLGAGAHLATFFIGGTQVTTKVRKYESEIQERADEQPNTASIVVRGTAPSAGQQLTIRFGGTIRFDGVITSVDLLQYRVSTRPRWRVDAVDWTRLLDRRLVYKTYSSQTPNAIISDLVSTFTTGFTTANVEAGLTWLNSIASASWTFNGDTVSGALTKIAEACGARFKLFYTKDIYLRATSTITSPTSLTSSNTGPQRFKNLKYSRLLDQIRTRVFVAGAGTRAFAPTAAGATILPIEDATLFSASGGSALVDATERMTYTGLVAGGTGSLVGTELKPTSAPNYSGTGAGSLSLGYYGYAITFKTATGETAQGPRVVIHTTASTSIILANVQAGPSDQITSRRIYRTSAQASQAAALSALVGFVDTIADNTTTDYTDTLADGSLGAGPPSTGTTNLAASGRVAAGTTTLLVLSASAFAAGGGWARLGSAGKISYTGKSGSTLTGIPASGDGSIESDVSYGTEVTVAPALTGIPPSGAGALGKAVLEGAATLLLVQRDDTTAQTALAALESGDGIHELSVSDSTLTTIDTLNARGDAELDLGADVEERATYTTEDPNTLVGGSVSISIAGISTSLTVQQQRIYWTEGRRWPQRDITASNRFKDLYQFLRELKDAA